MCLSSLQVTRISSRGRLRFREKDALLNLVADFHRRIHRLLAFVLAQVQLFQAERLGPSLEALYRCQYMVGRQVPEEGRRDSDHRPVGRLRRPPLHGIQSLLVDDNLMVAGLDEAPGDMLQLLSRLHEEVVSLGDLDGNPLACITCPDMEAWIPRAAVDGEKVQIGVEAGQDGVLLAVLA